MMLCCMLLIACRLEIVNGFGKEHHQIANFFRIEELTALTELSVRQLELPMNQESQLFYLLES